MLNYHSSDVLSPRELRRQLSRYFTYSMLFWIVLTWVGALFFLDLEVVPGKSLSLLTSPPLLLAFLWRLMVFSVLVAALGALLAFPSAALVWMANTGSSFSTGSTAVSARVRRGASSLIPVFLCLSSHLAFLVISLSASPIFASRLDGGKGLFWKPMSALYDLFYEDPASEVAKGWRKTLSDSQTSLLIVAIPARVLQNQQNFPLLEKEMGSPISFFLGSPSFEQQLEEILNLRQNIAAPLSFLRPSLADWQQSSNSDVQLALAPEYFAFGKAGSGQVEATRFLSQRFALAQPHLGMFGRIGLWERLFDGMDWASVDADDSYSLTHFLEMVRENPEARVRVLQLSALGSADPLGGIHPRRHPLGIDQEISQAALKVFDLKLGRALGALRQNRKLSVVVLPYSDRVSHHEFSNAFVRLAEGQKDPFGAKLRSRKSFAIAADVAKLRPDYVEPASPSVSDSEVRCEPMRVSPELLRTGAAEVRADLLRSAFSLVSPTATDVLFVQPEFRSFASDLYRVAAFCRDISPNGGVDRLVVWMGEGGVEFSEKRWPVMRDEIVTVASTERASKNLSAVRKQTSRVETLDVVPAIALNGRLAVFNMSVTAGVSEDPWGARFVEAHAGLLRSVFADVVLGLGAK